MTSLAEARPNTTSMSCGEAAATVARAGAIVLTTGEHTYERFVAASTFCLAGGDRRAWNRAGSRFRALPGRLYLPARRTRPSDH